MKRDHNSEKLGFLWMFCSSFLAGMGQLTWKVASTVGHSSQIYYLIDSYFLLGCFIYVIATFCMTLAFRYGEYSHLTPILSLSYVWVTLLSVYLFADENINGLQLTGILIISTGILFISYSKRTEHQQRKIDHRKEKKVQTPPLKGQI